MEASNAVPKTQIVLFVAVRIILNTTYRMIYPFLKAFATGMGISFQAATLPVVSRSLIGALAPLLAPVAERYGQKAGMLAGLSLFSLGTSLVSAWPSFPTFFTALVLAHLGNMMFLPAMQAYLADRIVYQRRGAVLAVTEMSWSLSFILLVPLTGLLIARLNWAAPFILLSALGWLALLVIAWRVPTDRPHPEAARLALLNSLGKVLANPGARTALAFSLLITLANEVVNLVFGAWLKDNFNLEIAALGLAATVIGAAELSGEAATALLVDRIGKKRAVLGGVIFTSLASLALPLIGRSTVTALAGLFLFYLGFEFTLVSFIPLMTQVMPEARATLMAVNLASTSLGRALGGLAGAWLYSIGFDANALAALLINAVALVALSQVQVDD